MCKIWVAALAVLLAGCLSEQQPNITDVPTFAAADTRARWIVVLNRGADREDVIRTTPGRVRHRYSAVLNGFAGDLPSAAVEALRRNPRVRYVAPERLVSVEEVGAWGIDRVDQRALPLDDSYTPQGDGTGVTLYSVDTGILFEHEQFEGRAGVGYDIDGGDGRDCHGHGTHTSGTMVGKTVGVAPAAHVIAVKIFSGCTGSTPTSEVIAGLDWIAANALHPAVVNMSIGGPRESPDPTDDATQALRDLGIHVVASAGNSSADACGFTPASSPGVISVAATTETDALALFSNTGPCVDIAAPGTGIRSGNERGTYSWFSGTSMSAPHVSGALALLLSKNADMRPAEAEADLLARATALSPFPLVYVNGFAETNPAPPRALPPAPRPPPEPPTFAVTVGDRFREFRVDWTPVPELIAGVRFRHRTPVRADGEVGGWDQQIGFNGPDVGTWDSGRIRDDDYNHETREREVEYQLSFWGALGQWTPLGRVTLCPTKSQNSTKCQ